MDRADGGEPVILDDLALLERVDPHQVRRALEEFPAQCRQASRLHLRPLPGARPRVLVVAGMGGSAAGGDLLATLAADVLEVPVLVHRGFGLPATAGRDALVVACSYSGETAEVLSAAAAALERGVPLAVVTSGGRLGRLADGGGLPSIAVPAGLLPRLALGHLFFAVLAAARAAGLAVVGGDEIAEALDALDTLGHELVPRRPTVDNEAKRLALALGERGPVVYGGPVSGTVAYRWKTDFEENAKLLTLAGALPELGHNTIEAWRGPAARALHLVLLRDPAEPPEIARRFAVLRELIGAAAGGLSEVWARGEGRLARLLSLVSLGQWTSYYLAVRRGIDPWTGPLLDELTRRTDGAEGGQS